MEKRFNLFDEVYWLHKTNNGYVCQIGIISQVCETPNGVKYETSNNGIRIMHKIGTEFKTRDEAKGVWIIP